MEPVEGGSPVAPEMGFGYELGALGFVAEIAQRLDLASGEARGFLASLMGALLGSSIQQNGPGH